jgi:hypothetical protein
MQWFEMISEEFNLFSYSKGNQMLKKLVAAAFKVIKWKWHRDVSPVEQDTIDCEYLAYLKFIPNFFFTLILCKILVRTL